MKNNLKEKFQDEKSENDLSEFTDKEVFKGANALYKEHKKENINNNNNIENKSNLKKISNDNTNLTKPLPQNVNPHNLLQNLIKNDNNNNVNSNNFISNNSISSSGFISFRNKKAKFVTLNTTNTLNNDNNKIEEEMDADAITMSILEKLGMNNLDSNNLNDNKNNNNLNNSSSSNNKDSLSDKEKNIFWNLKSNNNSNENINNNKSIENNELIYNESHNNSLSGLLNNEPKEKYLNSVICTLSLIDRGKAVFVSQDDMIFVLPSLFVPKNLKVGNTYMFKVSEFLNFNKKTKEIYNLQKQYLKEDNNNFEI